MDTCHGDIVSLPKDTLVGIKAFASGAQVAFLLASCSTLTILNRPQHPDINRISGTAALKRFICLISHIFAVVASVDFEWKEGLSSRIRMLDQTFGFISVAMLVVTSKHPKSLFMASAACMYALCIVQTTTDYSRITILIHTAASIVIAMVYLFVTSDRRCLNSEQHQLSGHLLVLMAFHITLSWLQHSEVVPEEVTSLCYALVAGCVRYNMTVLSCSADFRDRAAASEKSTAFLTGAAGGSSPSNDDEVISLDDTAGEQKDEDGTEQEGVDVNAQEEEGGGQGGPEPEEGWGKLPSSAHKELNRFQLEIHHTAEPELLKRMRGDSQDLLEGREAISRRKLLRYVFHEMRAPLNAISMAVELLTNQCRTAGATPKSHKADLETLQMIEEATLTMERTLKDSMTLQRIEEGLLVPQVKIFSVHDMCDDIHDALTLVLRSSSVRFTYSVDAAVPLQVVGDHFRLRHVVAHVVSNGIKFSRPGGEVRMHVSLCPGRMEDSSGGGADGVLDGVEEKLARYSLGMRESSAGGEGDGWSSDLLGLGCSLDKVDIVFRISDDGVGMSAELQASDIFKPFNTLKTDELNSFRGSGLGLAICKKIMHFLQGNITYSSATDQGTTFYVAYPLTRLDASSMDEYDSDEGASEGAEGTCGSLTALSDSHAGTPIATPEITRRKVALSKAKSFRGQHLYNIMQTQSSVFECPAPTSSSSASPRVTVSSVPHEFALTSIDEAEYERTPRPGDADYDSPRSNANEKHSLTDPSPPRPPSVYNSPRQAKKTLSARTLSINTHIGSHADRESVVLHSATSSFRSEAIEEQMTKLARSASSDSDGLADGMGRNSEYAALTKKNVHLHLLRSASSDVTRVLQVTGQQRPSPVRVPLSELLDACKVLVVDDAASNRKLLSMLLRRAGFGTVDLVEDGQAAVDYCQGLGAEEQPRIIFMDNTMPNLTGIEASKIIRAAGYRHLIIGVTGNSLEEELDEFLQAGADLVIVKPLKNQSLEMLLGFIQVSGFDSAHGFRIHQVGQEFTWVPRAVV